MRLGDREFSPRLWAVALYLAVLSSMLWLGNWQLQRAALKVQMQKAAHTALNAAALPVTGISDIPDAARRYTRVSLQGMYDGQRQFLWDNRTHNGIAGYEVLIPMQLTDGQWVLVNRGWVQSGLSRDVLPDVDLPRDVLKKTINIEGYLSVPSRGFASGEALSADSQWPKRIQFLDYAAIGRSLDESVLPALVQAQSLATDARTSIALTPRPEWLKANWQPAASGPAKHYSYAFQWFAMALALTGIFFIVNTRKATKNSTTPSQ